MLSGRPNNGWQLCFPLQLQHVGRTSASMTVPIKDLSIDEMVEA